MGEPNPSNSTQPTTQDRKTSGCSISSMGPFLVGFLFGCTIRAQASIQAITYSSWSIIAVLAGEQVYGLKTMAAVLALTISQATLRGKDFSKSCERRDGISGLSNPYPVP